MTLRHLRIFSTVYEEENVTRAAERLHMTQPAVSRSIRELESYYGVRLFDRLNHRIYPTDAAHALYARAVHTVGQFDELEREMKNWDEFGILRVGSTISLGTTFLPAAAAAFRAAHPDAQLSVSVSNAAEVERKLRDNEIDLGLIEGAVTDPELIGESIGEDRLLLLLPPDHPLAAAEQITLRDVAAQPLLCRERGSAGRDLLDAAFRLQGLTVTPAWESVSTHALIHAAVHGLGVAVLPEALIAAEREKGTLLVREIADASLRRPNCIVYHRHKFLTRMAKDFMALCRQRMQP